MNAMPKYVASRTLQDVEWSNSTLLQGDAGEAVAELRGQEGGPILVAGSRTLVHTLMEHGLVDEYRLMIFPVLVGGGRRLFPETSAKQSLALAGTQTFPSGVVVLSYRPAAA
jgi:dihydrofolate reductase